MQPTRGNSVRAASKVGHVAVCGINDTASLKVDTICNGDTIRAATVSSVRTIFAQSRLRRYFILR